ncbi:MAG: outer membrane protein assembly factor BamD [Candidatus Desulfofervidaceae bacterium]|nr:outer membrane protein assembly factor BamD [Candidatus Desulfofervidaceae bacterium]
MFSLFSFLFLFLLQGCGSLSEVFISPSPSIEEMSVKQLVQEGMDAFQTGKFDKAIEVFQHIKDAYPFSPYAVVAHLKLADAYYYKHDFENAIFSYEDFIQLHPKHKEIPYVLYQIGLCYFHQIPSIDRDQTITKKALESFKQVVREYPHTRYAQRALVKIQICRKKLAAHEFYVGRFYYRTGEYKSALLRFRYILENYPDLPISREAQRYLELCKSKLKKAEDSVCPLS